MAHRIGIIGGDGIGPEVIAEGLKAIKAAGVAIDTVDYDLGGARYVKDGTILPDSVLDEWRGLDALYLGAVGTPEVPPGVIERGLLRYLYGKDEVVLVLVTYALFLILEDLIKLVWGVDPLFVQGPKGETPYALLGNFSIGGLTYPMYNLLLVGVALITGAVLTWVLARTRAGKLLIAVIHDRETAAAMGIDVGRTYFITFTLGAMLAAVGGALTAPSQGRSHGQHHIGSGQGRQSPRAARVAAYVKDAQRASGK